MCLASMHVAQICNDTLWFGSGFAGGGAYLLRRPGEEFSLLLFRTGHPVTKVHQLGCDVDVCVAEENNARNDH